MAQTSNYSSGVTGLQESVTEGYDPFTATGLIVQQPGLAEHTLPLQP